MKIFSQKLLASTIKSKRKQLGITQVMLSEITDIHRTMLGRAERGTYIPTIDQLQKLARALNFEVVDLFIDENEIQEK